jgi:RNA polymerase sigma-70 factor (ECF subfamily)
VVDELLSFDEVYRRHAADVYRFCLFQLRDREAAKDVAADAFVAAFAAYDRVAPSEDTVLFWLIRIAKCDVIDHRRRAQRWRQVVITMKRERQVAVGEVEALVGVNENLRHVLEAMGSLSKRDRLLVGLRCGADLSFDEIGKLTGMSAKTATTATRRAIQRLRSNPKVVLDG